MSSYETIFSIWNKTLQYSNIFDYPLTQDEIFHYAITRTPIPRNLFDKWVRSNRHHLEDQFNHTDAYWTLKGRNKLVDIRSQRDIYSDQKIAEAQLISSALALIPWIKLLAITGTVAARNAHQNDDIDLFIITKKRRLWLTRASILCILTILAKRANNTKPNRPGYCLNHMITEDDLKTSKQNIYLANDIARMNVLIDRSKTYAAFIKANAWIKEYLANWWEEISTKEKIQTFEKKQRIFLSQFSPLYFFLSAPIRMPFVLLKWILDGLEKMAQNVQTKHLYRTYPLMQESQVHPLQFHPHNHSEWVLREYYLALQKS